MGTAILNLNNPLQMSPEACLLDTRVTVNVKLSHYGVCPTHRESSSVGEESFPEKGRFFFLVAGNILQRHSDKKEQSG